MTGGLLRLPRPRTRNWQPRASRWLARTEGQFLVPVLLLAYCALAATSAATKSATWDETNYFGMGDYLLRNGKWDVPSSVIHPPLSYYISSIPVLFADLDRQVWEVSKGAPDDLALLGAADVERGQALLSSPANDGDYLLMWSRFMVTLQASLLGWFVYRLGKAFYGWQAGILALTFFAFCPNMIAHGSLITPDMTLAVFFFISLYYLRFAVSGNHWKHYLLAGVSLGLTLLAKFPGLLLLPVWGALLAFALLTSRRRPSWWLLISLASAAFVVLAAYGFDLKPYLQGLQVQQGHAAKGHSAFLMGELAPDGWWYYCLVAFALKTPIPLLLFFAAAVCMVAARAIRRKATLDDLVLFVPILAFFGFFSFELRSIGLRYVLPVYPFAFVAASGAVMRLRRLGWLLAIPVLWLVAGSIAAWPHYLAYFNESIGGPRNGYRYLVDSNLDWGQDLKGLKRFMDSRGIDSIYLSYFGTDSPARYGIEYDWLPSYELKNPDPRPTIDIKRGRYLAISVTNLQGVYMEPPTLFRWLDDYTPVARIGHSIFVYYLE